MKFIPLTKGKVAIVDDDKYEELSKFHWYVVGHEGKEYAARYGGSKNNVPIHLRMHRLLMNAPQDMEVDHINGNRLDNRMCNLRLATRSENSANREKFSGTHSRFKGVTYHTRDKCWQSTIITHGKHIHLGYFETERDAALAYNKAARKYHGEFAKLNEVTEEN